MSELLKFRRKLEENELKAGDMRLRLQKLRESLRDALDPFAPVENLSATLIMSLSADFGVLQTDLKAVLDETAAIRHALGR